MKYFFFFLFLFLFSCQSEVNQSQSEEEAQLPTSTDHSARPSTVIPFAQSGIDFKNELKETSQINRLNYEYFYNGGGTAVGDINNDGLPDIYLVGNMVPDKLYLNLGGFKFKDITLSAGITPMQDWHTGVSMVDINGDGYLDIYVCRSGWFQDAERLSNLLYINNKNETFTESAASYGLDDTGYGVQASFFDADLDGDLDAMVLNNPNKKPQATDLNGYRDAVLSGEYGSDKFYENKNGKFVDATKKSGINTFGYRHGISIGDVNNDGWPDMYISGDFDDPDYLYVNNGDGTFTNKINEMMSQISMFSMGNDMADINRDGFMDVFVADMTPNDHERSKQNMASMNPEKFFGLTDIGFHHQYMINTLQLNNEGKSFSNIAHMAGVSSTDWSWSTLFLDWNLDGHEDLFITNGIKRDVLNNDVRIKAAELAKEQQLNAIQVLNLMPSNKVSNYFFENDGQLSFVDKSSAWLNTPNFNSNGAAYGDFDNDGDPDLIINNADDVASLIKNESSGHYIKIKLKGGKQNTFGIGSRVVVHTTEGRQMKDLYAVRGFCSSVEPILFFGLGDEKSIDKIEVLYGRGFVQTITNPAINQLLEIELTYTDKQAPTSQNKTHFTSLHPDQIGLDYRHIENRYDDYAIESLIPQRYSQNGPFMAKGDINGDGIIDVFIGGSRGESGTIFVGKADGPFQKVTSETLRRDSQYEDMHALFFDADGDEDDDLYVVSGGYEEPDGSAYYQDRLYINQGNGEFSKSTLPVITSAGQAIAAADIDGDGDIDVFRGGRIKVGEYPNPVASFFLINDGGSWKKSEPLPSLDGLVTDAAFADMDADGDIDLVVCGEWMPITLLTNDNGAFTQSRSFGPSGWYQSIFIDDIDNDGKPDIIAGNMGENNKFHPDQTHPLHVYALDFDGNQTHDIVLSKLHKGHKVPVRGRECSSTQMPFIKDKFPTFKGFAEASLEEVYGEQLDAAWHRQAESFAHFYFLSSENYQPQKLPRNSQRAPLMAFVKVNHGDDTYFVAAGNHYNTEVETSRYDAGIGVLFKAIGGRLEEVALSESGVYIPGDVKDLLLVERSNGQPLIIASRNSDKLITLTVNR